MAKSLVHVLEDELYMLWNQGYRAVDRAGSRLGLSRGQRVGYNVFLERQIVAIAANDRDVAAFACAIGIHPEYGQDNIDRRLIAFALDHGRGSSMTARRWARAGVKKVARGLIRRSSLIDALVVELTEDAHRIVVSVRSLSDHTHIVNDYFHLGIRSDFSLSVDDVKEFPLDLHITNAAALALQWNPHDRQPIELRFPRPAYRDALDFQLHWEGELSVATVVDLGGNYRVVAENYPQSTYVNVSVKPRPLGEA